MQILPPSDNEGRVVVLTDVEKVIVEWRNTLWDAGLDTVEAVQNIEDRVPHNSFTYKALQDADFRAYLLD